jgi:hypothetical protein
VRGGDDVRVRGSWIGHVLGFTRVIVASGCGEVRAEPFRTAKADRGRDVCSPLSSMQISVAPPPNWFRFTIGLRAVERLRIAASRAKRILS